MDKNHSGNFWAIDKQYMLNFYLNIVDINVWILSKNLNNANALGRYCPNIAQILSKHCLKCPNIV